MEIIEKIIDYQDIGGKNFRGVAYYPTSGKQLPGILVAHTIRGLSAFEKRKAKQLAEWGYITFAIDMYGVEYQGLDLEDARIQMNILLEDRSLLCDRISLAHYVLNSMPEVSDNLIAGIGFCFGGKTVLDLARANVGVSAVVSLHGILDPPNIHYNSDIKTKILVCHGWNDPLALPNQLVNFANEMTDRNADWQILAFGKVAHAFTNPIANDLKNGMHYDKLADDRSMYCVKNFFYETFNK